MLVKICGITNVDDARFAAGAGADLLGLVFVEKSKRYLTVERANAIVDGLDGPAEPVGLFADAEAERVVETVVQLRLWTIQLHGQESPAYIDQLTGRLPDCRIIKAVMVAGRESLDALPAYFEAVKNRARLFAFLLDGPDGGGTGTPFDWTETAKALAGRRENLPKIFLAGGLTIETVSDAISTLKPDGVDVSSGVEAFPGKKDEFKVKRFIQIAKEHSEWPRRPRTT